MASGDSSGSGQSAPDSDLPIGVERALARATRDDQFRADLRKRRGAAAEDVGIELTTAERAVLEAIDEQQLDVMIGHLEDRVVEVPKPQGSLSPAGIRPGQLVSQGIRPEAPAGIRPGIQPVMGVRPDPNPAKGLRPGPGKVRGIRPGLPIALVAGAVVVGGASAMVCATAGNRPDEPPPVEPTQGQQEKGEGSAGSVPDAGAPDGGDGGVGADDP
jgi:hypothetical protein